MLCFTLMLLLLAIIPARAGITGDHLRPPAVPLVTHDPFFSVWSPADKLTEADSVHWTRHAHPLRSLIRVDGATFRLLGAEPVAIPAFEQTGLEVRPTTTLATFEGQGVRVELSFCSPLLPDDLDVLSRPVTYITWKVASLDSQEHSVQLYFEASPLLTVNQPDEAVVWERAEAKGLVALKTGTETQAVLASKGDDHRINWGYLYLAAPKEASLASALTSGPQAREQFKQSGALLARDDEHQPRPAKAEEPVLALAFDLGDVTEVVERHALLAYDEEWAVTYFGQRLRPYWRRTGKDAVWLLEQAEKDREDLLARCERFDTELMADLTAAASAQYADIATLSYRQALAGCGLVADSAGKPLLFPKENTSNGCMGTVDVFYPAAPLMLALSPALARAMLVPLLDYSASERWPWPYAPHDIGVYPLGEGQVYGGGERTEEGQMPVEESANMLLLVAATCRAEGSGAFAKEWWPILSEWAAYLREKGFDPAHQLCTDDFAGPFAHNVNLSLKAILALGAYAQLAQLVGDESEAVASRNLAERFAKRWLKEADEGDHYRLAFDQPGTWSTKYNLIWDGILGLGLFPPEVAAKETTWYRQVAHEYGTSLDSRNEFAKTDWALWAASLAPDEETFSALVDPIWRFLNQVPERNPITDLYWVKTGHEAAMHARPVMGGAFVRLLQEPALWAKWAGQGEKELGPWAPFPKPRKWQPLVPTAEQEPLRLALHHRAAGRGLVEARF